MHQYERIISQALTEGGTLDALLALQKEEGFVSEAALTALAERLCLSPAELYETASFYSMLRFTPPARMEIRVCRGTACHSGNNTELVRALEKTTGLKMGESSRDWSLDYVECLGQCQAAPNLLINGVLRSNVEIGKLDELLGGEMRG